MDERQVSGPALSDLALLGRVPRSDRDGEERGASVHLWISDFGEEEVVKFLVGRTAGGGDGVWVFIPD